MALKILQPEEWDRLEPIFAQQDWHLPDPAVATVVVDENNEGEIIALGVLQLVLHAEPFWVRPEDRGSFDWCSITSTIERIVANNDLFPGVLVVAENAQSEAMARSMGMKEIKGRVFAKQILAAKSAEGEV